MGRWFEPFAACGSGACTDRFTITLRLRGGPTFRSDWSVFVEADYDGPAPSGASVATRFVP